MSQAVECERCGGKEFRLENGFYFCSECQLQTQELREEVCDEFYGGQKSTTKKVAAEGSETAREEVNKEKKFLSSYEILNYVLAGLVEELILLGAPKKLKYITLQLWSSYLQKIEVAFTSTSIKKKPKVGLYHRKSDAALFYKAGRGSSLKDHSSIKRKRRKRSKALSESSFSGASSSVRSLKLRLSRGKRSLAKAEYNESVMDMSLNASTSSLASNWSGEDRIRYTKKGARDIKQFLDDTKKESDDEVFYAKAMKRASRSIDYPRMLQVISILRIALLISDSDIHLGDLRRWTDEGYLSLDRLEKFIPDSAEIPSNQSLLINTCPTNFKSISYASKQMMAFLGVSKEAVCSILLISNLVKRYCKMLNLPEHISNGIDGLLLEAPPKIGLNLVNSNYEGVAVAYILFSLKILIGLDDVTEYSYIPREGEKGIKWEEWTRQYVARMAKKAINHQPTLVRLYPNSYIGRGHSLLSHWDTSTSSKRSETGAAGSIMKDALRKLLKPYMCKLAEPAWRPGLKNEAQYSGPLLIVLSERGICSGQKQKSIRIVPKYKPDKTKQKFFRRPGSGEVNIEVVDDNTADTDNSLHISTPDKKETPPSDTNDHLPDFNIWAYHSCFLVKLHNDAFREIVADKLPCSFLWLLEELASMVYQPAVAIYGELLAIENRLLGPRRYRRKDRRSSSEENLCDV